VVIVLDYYINLYSSDELSRIKREGEIALKLEISTTYPTSSSTLTHTSVINVIFYEYLRF